MSTEQTSSAAGLVIPDHDMLRCIGSGSYGEVWLARNVTGVYRAVKIVYHQQFSSDRPFLQEFSGIQRYEVVSRRHEGLLQVLHVGINDDQQYFFYVMELADDVAAGRVVDPATYRPRTLRTDMKTPQRLPVHECIAIGTRLTDALTCLHDNGLVHRDVKPENIIIVDGQPKLADIGLVAALGQQTFVGTEGYYPPEGPGHKQADMYGLGKVLYEISTGNDRLQFPALPADLGPDHDQELFMQFNRIVLTACQNDLTKRYPHLQEMQDDLVALGAGKPPPSRIALHAARNRDATGRPPALFARTAKTLGTLLLVIGGGAGFLALTLYISGALNDVFTPSAPTVASLTGTWVHGDEDIHLDAAGNLRRDIYSDDGRVRPLTGLWHLRRNLLICIYDNDLRDLQAGQEEVFEIMEVTDAGILLRNAQGALVRFQAPQAQK